MPQNTPSENMTLANVHEIMTLADLDTFYDHLANECNRTCILCHPSHDS